MVLPDRLLEPCFEENLGTILQVAPHTSAMQVATRCVCALSVPVVTLEHGVRMRLPGVRMRLLAGSNTVCVCCYQVLPPKRVTWLFSATITASMQELR
eukprot:143727-Rhodomonas_salina.1